MISCHINLMAHTYTWTSEYLLVHFNAVTWWLEGVFIQEWRGIGQNRWMVMMYPQPVAQVYKYPRQFELPYTDLPF